MITKVTGVEEIRIVDPSGLCKAEVDLIQAVRPSVTLPGTGQPQSGPPTVLPYPGYSIAVPHIPSQWSIRAATGVQWGEGLPPVGLETPLWEKNWQSRQRGSSDEGNPAISK